MITPGTSEEPISSALAGADVRHSRLLLIGRGLFYTLILFASWNFNLLGLPDGTVWSREECRVDYLGSESHLVVCRIAHPGLHPLHPLCVSSPDGRHIAYCSQFGLSGIVLTAVSDRLGLEPRTYLVGWAALFALLSAAILSSILALAQQWLGAPAGDIACVLAASTPVMLFFAPSLYWAVWLVLAPFGLVWCGLPRATGRRGRAILLGAVAIAVLAKSLCGYEYITTTILSPLAAAWFHQYRSGESWARILRLAIGVIAAGLLGFAAALAMHVLQQDVVLGQDGGGLIWNRAVTRVCTDPAAEARLGAGGLAESRSRILFAARCFLDYFDLRALSLAGGFGTVRLDVPLKVVVLIAAGMVIAAGLIRRQPRNSVALAGAITLGFIASVSWQVLAINHMCVHKHLNSIVFFVPFLPLAYLGIGHAFRLLVGPGIGRALGSLALGGVVTVMGVNVMADRHRRAAEAAEQQAAEAVVARALTEPSVAPQRGVGGSLDAVTRTTDLAQTLLLQYGLLDLATGRPSDPDAVLLQGWAVGCCKTTSRPLTRIVVCCDGQILPCQVLRFRRRDMDRLLGQPVAGTGFIAVVPRVVGRRSLRVFVVSTLDPHPVFEIKMPSQS